MMVKAGWFMVAACLLGGLVSVAKKEDAAVRNTMEFSDGVTQVVNYTALPVEYRRGNPKIEITGTEEQLKNVSVEIDAKSIVIRDKGNQSQSYAGMSVRIYGDDIGSFTLYGSGGLRADNIDGTGISIGSYGSGDIGIRNLDSTRLRVDLYGSGDVNLEKVDCTSLVVVSNGSGTIKMSNIDSTSAELIHQGSGNITISNLDATSLKATSNGTGDLTIDGDVTSAVLICNGTGTIDARSLNYNRVTPIRHSSGGIRL